LSRRPPLGQQERFLPHRLNARWDILLHGSAGLTSWGRVGIEDHPSFRERDFAAVGQDYRRPVNLGERQIRLSSPRWEGATPSIVLLGCPPCRSRPMPIAVITSPGSRIG